MRNAAERAGTAGIVLAANNHVGSALETVAGTRRFLDRVCHRNVGLLYDAMHLTVAGEDVLGCSAQLLPFVRNVLVQSVRPARADEPPCMTHEGRRWTKALVDEVGAPDWPGILGRFRRLGYDGPITVIENGWEPARRDFVARHTAACVHAWWARA